MNLIIRSEDFSRDGAKGKNIEMPKQESIDPCLQCHNRQRCITDYLACDRYVTYVGKSVGYVAPSKYMPRPTVPSRSKFVELFGDDDLPPLQDEQPDQAASRQQIRAALEAAREAQYPPMPPEDENPAEHYRIKNRIGTYRQWRNRQDKIIWTLNEKLRQMQEA